MFLVHPHLNGAIITFQQAVEKAHKPSPLADMVLASAAFSSPLKKEETRFDLFSIIGNFSTAC
jgi:hypothetical protein